jgi:hypothetical protein
VLEKWMAAGPPGSSVSGASAPPIRSGSVVGRRVVRRSGSASGPLRWHCTGTTLPPPRGDENSGLVVERDRIPWLPRPSLAGGWPAV